MGAESLPVPMLLPCPSCGDRHVDRGDFATKPHHTHACQSCGMVWRPAIGPTVGVQFLPGFKDGGDLTPSEAALSKVLAAWVEWPGDHDNVEGDSSDALAALGDPLKDYALVGEDGEVTPTGAALLDRARKAGVL